MAKVRKDGDMEGKAMVMSEAEAMMKVEDDSEGDGEEQTQK